MRIRLAALAVLTAFGINAAPTAAQATPPATSTGTPPASATTSDVSAAAPGYWYFRNRGSGKCMSTYESGVIRELPCNTSSNAQHWHWVNSGWNSPFRLLKNRWTGRCLVSTYPEITSGSCDDWTSRHWQNLGTSVENGYRLLSAQHGIYLDSSPDELPDSYLSLFPYADEYTEWYMRAP